MPIKQSNVLEELILPRKRGPTRAFPLGLPTIPQVALQIREHREILLVASIARVHLRAVASLEVILHAHDRLQRPEFLVLLVPIASFEGAREARGAREIHLLLRRFRQSFWRLELISMCAHVHPQIRVAPEPFPADLAEMNVFGEQFHGVELHDLAIFHQFLRKVSRRRRRRQILRVGDEGGAVDDNLVDGGDDLAGHHVHLVLADEGVGVDRFGYEALKILHPRSNQGEILEGNVRIRVVGIGIVRRIRSGFGGAWGRRVGESGGIGHIGESGDPPILIISRLSKSNGPPSPPSLPLIGHVHLLPPIPHRSFHNLSSRYRSILQLLLGSVPCFIASTLDATKHFLKTHESSFSDRFLNANIHHLSYDSQGFLFRAYSLHRKFTKKLCMTRLLGGPTLHLLHPVRRTETMRFL
ncbi:3,9-dihydroxypterocarpan 6A-monooxygenase-like [Senna tora]|uniref:3,9-dihydroxypterocarpan 6A-monooxygenase-like n=1 Tax=Senna tora TaxID=362788 RepID=A0A835CI36_9FABA|nr:3,9-dihydroxypterocarpan 6A-monooxygenase-like [Senna tora]